MATKVTQEDKIRMNELYLKYKTYAEVARQTGFSASTVKKYIISDFILPQFFPKIKGKIKRIAFNT